METQDFKTHRRFVPGFHLLLSLLLLIGLAGAGLNIYKQQQVGNLLTPGLIGLLFICLVIAFWYIRQFPIKAQDRAIRAEESLRYYVLSGKPLDGKLTVYQIAALRFASDEEFLILADKASAENLSPDEIKKAIIKWKADYHRV